jgi:hypothetical protein
MNDGGGGHDDDDADRAEMTLRMVRRMAHRGR